MVPWLSSVVGGESAGQSQAESFVIELANLGGEGEALFDAESPITSGSDPSSWDPIAMDVAGRVDTCADQDSKQPKAKDAAAVCQSPDKPDK